MSHQVITRTASELRAQRCTSPIGSEQRLYQLDFPATAASGACHRAVAVITGASHTYAYAAGIGGQIADWTALATVEGRDDAAVLAALGYRIAEIRGAQAEPAA